MIGLLRKLFLGPTPDTPEAGDQLDAGPIGGEISGRISYLIGDYDPHCLTYDRMKQMRNDADVAFGIAMVRAPIINRTLTVEGEDAEVVAYASSQLQLHGRTLAKVLTNAEPFGYKVAELVWKTGPYTFLSTSKDGKTSEWKTLPNAWTWDRVKSIDGNSLTLLADEISGEFLGVRQTGIGGKDRVCGPQQLALWSFRKEDVDDHLRGFPLLGQAYSHWHSKHANRIARDAYLKRDAHPMPVGRAVIDQVRDEKGGMKDGYSHMRRILNSRQAGAFVILPSTIDEKTGKYKFDIQYLEDGGKAGAVYQAVCDKEGVQILRSFGITDEVGTSQDTGSRSRSQTHQETFLDTIQGWSDDYIDDTLTPKLKENCTFNYGKERVERANLKVRAAGISAGERDTLQEVLQKVMDAQAVIQGGGKILLRNRIDAVGICQSLKIPLLPEDEVEPDPPAEPDPTPNPTDPNQPINPAMEAAVMKELERRGALSMEPGDRPRAPEYLGEIRTIVRDVLTQELDRREAEELEAKPPAAPAPEKESAADLVKATGDAVVEAIKALPQPPAPAPQAPQEIHHHAGDVIVQAPPAPVVQQEIHHHAGDTQVDVTANLKPGDRKITLKTGDGKTIEGTSKSEGGAA